MLGTHGTQHLPLSKHFIPVEHFFAKMFGRINSKKLFERFLLGNASESGSVPEYVS